MERETWSSFLLPASLIAGLVILLSLNLGPVPTEPAMTGPLEHALERAAVWVAAAAEMAAALVIGLGVLRAIGNFLLKLRGPENATESIRVQLGRALALGLEFTIASDILRTAIAPTRQVIANLAAIVLLRTLLNYFLEREVAGNVSR